MFKEANPKYKWDSLKKYVQKSLKNEKTGHDYQHIKRVINNALLVSKGVKVNYDVLLASSLLHDISYKDKPSKTHHIESSKIAIKILPNYGFKKDIIKMISHAILNHNRSFSPQDKIEEMSIEAKVLCDADTLDALGVIGIIRMISFSINQKIPYFISKKDSVDTSFYGNIKYLKDIKNNLILNSAKEISRKRMKIVYEFIK